MGFPRQEYWSVALSFSRGSSQLRHRTWVSFISGLPTEPPGKPCWSYWQLSNFAYILQCIPIDTSKWSQLYPIWAFSSVQVITQSCLTLCYPMSCSTPGLPVHHQLPEFTQTHVHWVGDAIQPFHPLSSPSPPSIFPSIRVFSNELVLLRIRWSKYWSFSFSISLSNEHSGLIFFRMD